MGSESVQDVKGHGLNEEDVILPSHVAKICHMSVLHDQLETFDK